MIYGQIDINKLNDIYSKSLKSRKEISSKYDFSNLSASDRESVSDLKTKGYSSFNLNDNKLIWQISKIVDTLLLEKKISRIRKHNNETLQDIQNGNFSYFTDHQVNNNNFNISENASLVTIKDPFINIPELISLVFNNSILNYVSNYFEVIPLLTYCKITVSFPNNNPLTDTQYFHVDFGSKKILKIFIYLDNILINDGPFVYVKNSHNTKFSNWDHKSRFSESEIVEHYSQENIVRLVANRGEIIAAETTGFHKGDKPINKNRKVLILSFALHPEVGFDYNKINIQKKFIDKLSSFQKEFISNDIFCYV